MNLSNISLKSLFRQKGKKVFLLIAMVISLTTVLTLYSYVESQRLDIENQFDEFGANIVITPKSDSLVLSYGGVNISGIVTSLEEIEYSQIGKIKSIENNENIRAISPKLIGAGEVSFNGIRNTALLVGIELEEEKKIKSWWNLKGTFPEGDNEVLIGAAAAEVMKLSIGDTFTIKGTVLKVTSILASTGSQDDNAIMAPIETVQTILGKPGKISLVEVSALCVDCPIDDLVFQISQVMPNSDVKAIRQVMEQKMQVVDQVKKVSITIGTMLVILCGLLIFSTVTGSISDRKQEIGIFRAIGFTKSNIMQIILTESFLISLASGFLGILCTYLTVNLILPSLVDLSTENFRVNIWFAFTGAVSIIMLGLGASWWPAISASNIDPVKTINSL
ncbi:MAG: ABC transporter permease [Spirochaetaceae bacterium]|nr:ABC transporter permease [Spirochaetaceae bacterium]